ncbi:Zn-finger-containing protein [Mycobacteroides abscessus subsp. abscessus]|nr:Zn-finger-containing protein [Mycobacteroides abscessus subsp. abscessus]
MHLRRCAQCGHIGCCDTSPSQHATAHHRQTGHPFIQSYEPGEDWYWDFRTEEMFTAQGVPGPSGRVPADWREHIH